MNNGLFICRVLYVFLAFSTLMNVPAFSQVNTGLNAIIKLHSKSDLILKGVKIKYTNQRDGEQLEKISSDSVLNNIFLKFNTTYIVEFTHEFYYSKSVEIKTSVPRKQLTKSHSIDIEVAMDQNCEGNPNFADVIFKPIGRIQYNKSKNKFDYDWSYTYRMGARYTERKRRRCAIVAEQVRARKKLEKLESKALTESDTSLQRLIREEKERIAFLEKEKKNQIEADRAESRHEEELLALEAEKRKNEAIKRRKRSEDEEKERITEQKKREEDIKRANIFDETQKQIFIYPNHSWPSEISEFFSNPDYKPRPIGTFTYDLTKSRKEFYISDVEELRQKFPKEFNNAFKNWDYIYNTHLKYKESHQNE